MIYFIREACSGWVKVGWCQDAASFGSRLDTYKTNCPGEVSIVRVIDGDKSVELDVHALLADKHKRGEWFDASDEDIAAVVARDGLGTLYVSATEAARIIGCGTGSLCSRIKLGHVQGHRIVGHDLSRWFVPREWAESMRGKDIRYAVRVMRVGSEKSSAKLKDDDIPVIRQMYADGVKCSEIEQRFGVSQSIIHRIVTGKGWRHVPGDVPGLRAPVSARGESHPRAKLTNDAVREIRRRREEGATCDVLASEFGVAKSSIFGIVNRKTWSHVV